MVPLRPDTDYVSLSLPGVDKTCLIAQKLQVSWPAEVTVIVAIILLGWSLRTLQSFVEEYAYSLVERQSQVSRLSLQNAQLKKQLDSLKKEVNLDLDSPITKVINIIKSIIEKNDFSAEVTESLDYVIHILSSNQLFLPNLNVNSDAMDSDVNRWLTAMVTNKAETAPAALPLAATFDLDPVVIKQFLTTIESGYRSVPYHNSIHAADVMHALHYFISELHLNEVLLPEVTFSSRNV
ncbi:High affinity cAMP-specific 3',5'-cyclic phosphodiesterase 7A [Cladochytrium tenue]|nr:High affinity cAMP-specific 3',5'-cyclic phosphodiesterase 7A [Cladochytrium tenue]